jgi:porphobilinogen synthase
MYPQTRFRRNRRTPWVRDLLAESHLKAGDLILPVFILEGHDICQEIKEMPGVHRRSIDQLLIIAKEALSCGILAIALFPVIDSKLKNESASEAYNPNNLVCRAIKAIKGSGIEIGIICDVALDPYTNHGHDGIVKNDIVDNDVTVEALCKQALVLVGAGADILAPSDMMDGRIMKIRAALDKEEFYDINILSYAAKYASSFYGPFRAALNITDTKIDKSTYQMDVRNLKEALLEIESDIKEGADMIMIKPGLAFLDVIYAASSNFNTKIFAYQVSGEYAMLKFAEISGAISFEKSLIETLISFKRAGASGIFTYGALEAAKILNKKL